MSASDPEHLDALMDAHAYTCIETRVCLVQCWKLARAALSLKAVYCDRHTAFSLPLSLSLLPIFFTLFFTLAFERRGGPFPHAVRSASLTLLHRQLWYCLSLSPSYLLHQRHVSSSKAPSWQPWRVQWTGERVQWIREGSGIPHQLVIDWLHHINHVWSQHFINHEQLCGHCNSPSQTTVQLKGKIIY